MLLKKLANKSLKTGTHPNTSLYVFKFFSHKKVYGLSTLVSTLGVQHQIFDYGNDI